LINAVISTARTVFLKTSPTLSPTKTYYDLNTDTVWHIQHLGVNGSLVKRD